MSLNHNVESVHIPRQLNLLGELSFAIAGQFKPTVLPNDSTIMYNVPSSHDMRNAFTKFGISSFNSNGLLFWNSCLSNIKQFSGASTPNETYSVKRGYEKISGFCSLAMHISEEIDGLDIQEFVKSYFLKKFVNSMF